MSAEKGWLSVVDAAGSAAVGAGSWGDALSALAVATGSRSGQLLGLGDARSVFFNFVTDLAQDWMDELMANGGADPGVNPFMRGGSQLPVLEVRASADFITPHERRHNPFLNEHAHRQDIPYICLTPLVREADMLIGLAVMRSARQGEIATPEREMFTYLAAHLRTAVRTQMALEHQGAQLVPGALETLTLAGFVCDGQGIVRAMTPHDEALVSTGEPLGLKHGGLRPGRAAESRALSEAIELAASGLDGPGAPLARSFVIHSASGDPVVVDVLPLPRREYAFGFQPRVLVVVRRGMQNRRDQTGQLLQAAYHLTTAEADVALRLAEGQPPDAIAAVRRVSVDTVRAQIRAIYSKFGVHRQSELVGRLAPFR